MKSGFSSISIEDFIKSFIQNNPDNDPKDLRQRLQHALNDYKKGKKCSCGNEIWGDRIGCRWK